MRRKKIAMMTKTMDTLWPALIIFLEGEEEVMMDATSHNSNNRQEEVVVEDKKRSKLHRKVTE
jgi:hypothetical protein